jgi:hypothetical protein
MYIPNLATSKKKVSGISMARQGDRVVYVGGTRRGSVPTFDEANLGGHISGSFGLKIRLMMALMTVMLIWTDRRRERKMFADACGFIAFGRVAIDSWVKAFRIHELVMARSMSSRFLFLWNVVSSYSGAERKR